uniref:BspA family leucine-rich repeat surface protein n=1 Tax=Ellagibacter isourolithinifaciens TaxID=2137581 RepID=UPI003AB0B7FF
CISFSFAFYNCTGLQHLDISHWSNKSCKPGPQSWGYVPFGHSGGGYPDLEYVKIGAGWDHVGDLLRNTNTFMKVTSADGNWYALSDSAAYSSDTAPDNKADTYYTTKALLDQAKTPTAFAVYSADDHSLDFYKRPRYLMPVSGSAFEGKAATAVYTGFETASYGKKEGSDSYIPWASVAYSVLSAEVVDDGIAPISIAHWFDYFHELRTCDLGKLNVTNVTSMDGTFYQNYALSSLTMPTSEFSSLVNMSSSFTCCSTLESIDLSRVNFSNITDLAWTFAGCNSLVLDCSDWDVSNVTSYGHFNDSSPNVTLPRAWQPTAFAVYSADNWSLDFYKREFKDIPKAGDTFEGKAVTEVYTGFETQRFVDASSNHDNWTSQKPDTPWWARRLEISSVQVVDTGIRPSSMDYWFYGMENLKTIDVVNLDTSSCDDFKMTFGNCVQIETIDLSSWSTASLGNLNGTFLCCHCLSSLDIDGWDTSKVTSFHCLMFDCKKMSSASMQKAVDNLNVTACAHDLGFLFGGCEKLTAVDLTGWNISNVANYSHMFSACHNLTLDCSNWNIRQDSLHDDFNLYAPGVILPKPWQATEAGTASDGDGMAGVAEFAGGSDVGAGDESVSVSSSPIETDNPLA